MKYPRFWLVFGLLISSCTTPQNPYEIKQCQNQERNHTKYQKCDLSDIKDYYHPIIDHTATSDKVFLYLQGGPDLSTIAPTFTSEFEGGENDFFRMLDENQISLFLINQSQWMKQAKFKDGFLFNFNEKDGHLENLETVNTTHKVISHFKNQGKKVFLYGSSYGATLINEYLVKYGDDLPDYVFSAVGRLKMKNTSNVILAKERERLTGYEFHILENDEVDMSDEEVDITQNPDEINNDWKLTLEMGFKPLVKDFTKLIMDSDLKKTTFFSAAPDQYVRWFNEEEINWARGRGAKVDVLSKEEVTKSWVTYFGESKEPIKQAIKWYAHAIIWWDPEKIEKYFIKPFAK